MSRRVRVPSKGIKRSSLSTYFTHPLVKDSISRPMYIQHTGNIKR